MSKKITTEKLLLLLCLILTVTYILSFFVNKSQNTGQLESVLLNPKYKELVTQIEISSLGNSIIFFKETNNSDDLWMATISSLPHKSQNSNDLIVPIKNSYINEYLDVFMQINLLDLQSSKPSSYYQYGLTEEQAKRVIIRSDAILTDIYFGNNDFSENKIFLRSSKNLNAYRARDLYSPYISMNTEEFADMKVISDSAHIDKTTIQKVELQNFILQNTKDIVLYNHISTADNFDAYISKLFSARGSSIIPVKDIRYDTLAYKLTMYDISKKLYSLEIYQNENSFFVVPNFENSPFSYALEISEWTLDHFILPS